MFISPFGPLVPQVLRARRGISVRSLFALAFCVLLFSAPRRAHAGETAYATAFAWGDDAYGQLGDGVTEARGSGLPVVGLPAGVHLTAISAGGRHSLAIGSDGHIYAWGDNTYGQLGSDGPHAGAVAVGAPLAGAAVTAVAAGGYHSLALTSDGKVYQWGARYANFQAAPGDPNRGVTLNVISDSLPSPVAGLPNGSTAIAAGSGYSMAVDATGAVWVWCADAYWSRQWAPGGADVMEPKRVAGFPAGVAIASVSAGYAHFLALGSDGVLYAWGDNAKGQLGDGGTTARSAPAPVTGFPAGVKITAAAAECNASFALGSDGRLYAWGDNPDGLLGVPGAPIQSTPAPVTGFPDGVGVASFSAGGHAVQFADYAAYPNGLVRVVGTPNTLAIGTDGKTYAWGGNASGQLGDGGTAPQPHPVEVSPLPGAVAPTAVSEGGGHSVAIAPYAVPAGATLAFTGRPGGVPVAAPLSPQPVVTVHTGSGDVAASFNGVITVALKGGPVGARLTGNPHVTAVNGVASFSGLSVDSPGVYTLAAYSAGMDAIESSPFVVTVAPSGNGLYAWGSDNHGQLGTGDPKANSPFPVPVAGLPDGVAIRSLASGGVRTTTLGSDGGVYEWGLQSETTQVYYDHGGYNGGGCQPWVTTVENTSPVRITGLPAGTAITAVATGYQHSLALDANGVVYHWGLDNYALTGYQDDGGCEIYTYYRTDAPTPVVGFPAGTRIAAIAAGGGLSGAITDSGEVYVWGLAGYIGPKGSLAPVPVTNFPHGVTAASLIVGGSGDYFALGTDGVTYHWSAGSALASPYTTAPQNETVRAITPFQNGVMALTASGHVYLSSAPTLPIVFPDGITAKAIASDASYRTHMLALGSDGRMYAWGANNDGQLGLGDTMDRSTTVPIAVFPAGATISGIVAAPGFSAALTAGPAAPRSVLQIAAGLAAASRVDMENDNVADTGPSADRLDIVDAVTLARQAIGLAAAASGTP